jgi:uncharacterized membrane protein
MDEADLKAARYADLQRQYERASKNYALLWYCAVMFGLLAASALFVQGEPTMGLFAAVAAVTFLVYALQKWATRRRVINEQYKLR